MIKKIFALCILTVLHTAPCWAVCAPGSNWTAAWTDSFNQTTYTLNAPCKVYIGIPFSFTATVKDNIYPNAWVAHSWALKDNGTIISGGGFNKLWLINGQWQNTIQRTYSGIPIDHTLEFKFTDMGQGSGAHYWGYSLIGAVTVDPYPDAIVNIPPVVSAGPDLALSSQEQAATVINGYTSDANGDALTYRWLEGTTELQPSQPVGISGQASLSLASIPPLSIGTHTLTLEVSDGKDTVRDDVWIVMENTPPTVVAVGSGTFQIGQDISLNGSVSDYDGDGLDYQWLDGASLFASGRINTVVGGSPVAVPLKVLVGGLPLGTHILVLQVSDGIHLVTSSITVHVIDTVAPSLAPTASTYILWPQNHQMVDVSIQANAVDNSGGAITLSAMITSNEPAVYDKQGNLIADYSVTGIDQRNGILYLQLRASRLGNGNGRIYTITLNATDVSGNSSSAAVQIKVPHDVRGNNYPRHSTKAAIKNISK